MRHGRTRLNTIEFDTFDYDLFNLIDPYRNEHTARLTRTKPYFFTRDLTKIIITSLIWLAKTTQTPKFRSAGQKIRMTVGLRCPLLTRNIPKMTSNMSIFRIKLIILAWLLTFNADDSVYPLNSRIHAMLLGSIFPKRLGLPWKWVHTQSYSELITSWISRTRFLTSLNRDTYQNIIMKDTLFVKLLNRTLWTCNKLNCSISYWTHPSRLVSANWGPVTGQCGLVSGNCSVEPVNRTC